MYIGNAYDNLDFFAHETITGTGAVVQLDPTVFAVAGRPIAKYGLGRIEGGDAHAWADGSTPSSTDGMLLKDTEQFVLPGGNNLKNFRAYLPNGVKIRILYA